MTSDAVRVEARRLTTYLMSGERSEHEQDAALRDLQELVPHPRVSALIFWPSHEGFVRELSPDEVVNAAMSYRAVEV